MDSVSSSCDEVALESTSEHSVIMVPSRSQDVVSQEVLASSEDDCVILERSFSCLAIPPMEVPEDLQGEERNLPDCANWEEFLRCCGEIVTSRGRESSLPVVEEAPDKAKGTTIHRSKRKSSDIIDNIVKHRVKATAIRLKKDEDDAVVQVSKDNMLINNTSRKEEEC